MKPTREFAAAVVDLVRACDAIFQLEEDRFHAARLGDDARFEATTPVGDERFALAIERFHAAARTPPGVATDPRIVEGAIGAISSWSILRAIPLPDVREVSSFHLPQLAASRSTLRLVTEKWSNFDALVRTPRGVETARPEVA